MQFIVRTATDAATVAEQVRDVPRADAQSESYPTTALGERLRLIARLIRGGLQTRVYYAVQAGYDTHAGQLLPHAELLGELAGAVQAFFADLDKGGLGQRVLLLAFSEFGRRVQENTSEGTDHGTAGPVLLAGGHLQGGLIGATPSLLDLEDGDVKMSIDFRQIYATVLEDWLGVSSSTALNGGFEPLPLFTA